MEKEFVPYELAVKLKELGFDMKCLGWYDCSGELTIKKNVEMQDLHEENTLAPLWQQAFDWFREKYNLSYCVAFNGSESYYWWITECKEFGIDINSIDEFDFKTYREARQACLEKLIDLVTNK